MKKVKLISVAAALLGLLYSPAAYADGYAPGEGLYIGAFGASSIGIVQPKVATNGSDDSLVQAGPHQGATFETTEGGLGLMGIEGGGMLGYGYKMGDIYAGIEGEMAAGDVEFKLTSTLPVSIGDSDGDTEKTIQTVEAKRIGLVVCSAVWDYTLTPILCLLSEVVC